MSRIKRDIQIRVRWLYVIFVIVGLTIVGRIVQIQFGPSGEELRGKAIKISFEREKVEAMRGDILARDGRLLATTVPRYEIRMDFAAAGLTDTAFKAGVDSLAAKLSAFYGDRSRESYRNMLLRARADRARNRYTLVSPPGHRIDYIERAVVDKFPIFRLGRNRGGYMPEQINKRLLPNGSLAERTIGYVGQGGVKIGIEGTFDEYLRGEDGSRLMQRIAGSFKVPVNDGSDVKPRDGLDVTTTLDVEIQDLAEAALKRQLDKGGADWGAAALMEASTGEIRAMANITRRGPGNFAEDYNYAVMKNLEPGSTFKLASLMALVEDGGMKLDHMIETGNGRAVVNGAELTDDHKLGRVTLKEVFTHSSNIGFARAVEELYHSDPKRYTDFVARLGFYDRLGLQLDGEPAPKIYRPGDKGWRSQVMTMMSHGYGLETTPLHTLTLYNAVANSGRMMRPLLVTELGRYGRTVRSFSPETINSSVCSRSTLDKVRECLEGVVDEGTAVGLRNPHYKVAAKTGTAQIALANVEENRHGARKKSGYTDEFGGRHYLATIVGYFPADKPRYTLIVCIKTYYGQGHYNTFYGASLAGPVFRAIADRLYVREPAWQIAVDDTRPPSDSASIKGGSVREVRRVASRLSLEGPRGDRPGDWARVTVDSLGLRWVGVEPRRGVTPDVRGMGLKEALYLLERSGLRVGFTGRGSVISQSLPPGTRAAQGTRIEIVLRVNSAE
ncbi:MAG: transpeptidase family protein [Rikenellaceae bacterium]|jgi:cell division protein FtsI (penicillin-binding protein 3)|nr:transpeptidase family protein [Rikenellaceae bacterium]